MITAEKDKTFEALWEGEDFWEGDPWAPIPENFHQFGSKDDDARNAPTGANVEVLAQNIFKESLKISQNFSGFSDDMEGLRKK